MVNNICAISGCGKESYPGCGLSFHSLPSDLELKKKWLEVTPGNLNKSSVVCSLHFKLEDYRTEARKRLKPGVVPSIFPKVVRDVKHNIYFNKVINKLRVLYEILGEIMRWSENETCQFVQLYLGCEPLWNTKHEDYKIKEKRLEAYKTIISEFHSSTGILLSVSELKVKIKNLRSTYTQELSKIKQRSGPDYTYKPTIKWFAYWHKRFGRNSRINKIPDTLYEEAEKDSKMWVHDETANLNDETHLDSFMPENNEDYILLLKSEPEEDQLKTTANSNTYKIKRKKMKHRSLSTASEGTFRGSLDSNPGLSKEDEFDIYGKYIASQLRSMNLKKALKLQLEIQSLVSEARLSELSNE